jgi:formyl-CoA transferase
MYAYSGILSALLQRQQTGAGSHVEVSMLEALTEWMGFPMYYAYDNQPQPGRNGAAHATIYPYGPFEAGDGKVVMLGLQNEREWKLFCDMVLQQPALTSDPRFDANARRVANRDALAAIILQAFAGLAANDVIARLDEAQIANAAVNQIGDLWAHPQLQARGRYRTIGSPAGELQALLPPANNHAFECRMDPVPALGEHTIAILRGLGRSDVDIAQLSAGGVV